VPGISALAALHVRGHPRPGDLIPVRVCFDGVTAAQKDPIREQSQTKKGEKTGWSVPGGTKPSKTRFGAIRHFFLQKTHFSEK